MRNKTCRHCMISLPLSDFNKDTTKSKDGYAAQCKTCKNRKRKVSIHSKPQKILSTPVRIHPENINEEILKDLDNITMTHRVPLIEETVFTQLSQKFGRMFSIRIEKDLKTEIRVYGDHSEQFYGKTPDDAILLALQ